MSGRVFPASRSRLGMKAHRSDRQKWIRAWKVFGQSSDFTVDFSKGDVLPDVHVESAKPGVDFGFTAKYNPEDRTQEGIKFILFSSVIPGDKLIDAVREIFYEINLRDPREFKNKAIVNADFDAEIRLLTLWSILRRGVGDMATFVERESQKALVEESFSGVVDETPEGYGYEHSDDYVYHPSMDDRLEDEKGGPVPLRFARKKRAREERLLSSYAYFKS
jgi:hypothetical protein